MNDPRHPKSSDSELKNAEPPAELIGEEHDEASAIAGETFVQPGTAGRPSARRSEAIEKSTGRSAFLVGAGILISRIIGLIRQRVFAHYFGLSDAADAFNAAFKIPNFLQNVFGEGALSASFIPVYAKLLAEDDEDEASHVASAVLTLLALATSLIVLIGVLTTPYLIDLIAPGFEGAKRELTIRLVKIFFPGAGLLVLSAWCLGVLNSHRKFFLSYTAPVIWNLAIIGALVGFGARVDQFRLAELVAWGSVVGSALQFAVQLPTVLSLLKRLRPVFDVVTAEVRSVVRNFFPVFFSRGVVQISAFVDAWLASWLGTGAVGALSYTQSIYTLPVSLFGMAVSAAELPAMASALGTYRRDCGHTSSATRRGSATNRVLHSSVSDGFSRARRCHGGSALPDRRISARCGDLCLGHSRRLKCWIARVHPRAIVFIDLLRAQRHAHALALRHRACGPRDYSRLSGRSPAAALSRH